MGALTWTISAGRRNQRRTNCAPPKKSLVTKQVLQSTAISLSLTISCARPQVLLPDPQQTPPRQFKPIRSGLKNQRTSKSTRHFHSREITHGVNLRLSAAYSCHNHPLVKFRQVIK